MTKSCQLNGPCNRRRLPFFLSNRHRLRRPALLLVVVDNHPTPSYRLSIASIILSGRRDLHISISVRVLYIRSHLRPPLVCTLSTDTSRQHSSDRMDMIVQYDYDQASNSGTMDAIPSLAVDIMPTFVPAHLPHVQNNLIPPQPDMRYMLDTKTEMHVNSVGQPMHTPIASEMSLSSFLDCPMESIEAPSQQPLSSAGYSPADPFTMLSYPEKVDISGIATSMHGPVASSILSNPSTFGIVPTSSLDTALDSSVTVGQRSHANTSLSPQSLPSNFPSLSPPRLQPTPTIDYPSTTSNSSADEPGSQTPPRSVIGKLLKECVPCYRYSNAYLRNHSYSIAKTAFDAGNAFEMAQGGKQTTKVGELRDRIVHVLDMLAHMSVSNGESPSVAQIPPELLVPEAIRPVDPFIEPSQVSPLLASSDHSRKRCASELEEHRVVKALKREPQDDAPLSAVIHEEPSFNPPLAYAATAPTFPVFPPLSQPPSRAPSPPPTFASANSFKPPAPAFLPIATGGAPLPAPQSALPNSAAPPFPHASWSDPVITTSRRQHSLSLGSVNGPSNVTSSSGLRTSIIPPNGLRNPLPQGISPPINVLPNSSAATISPSIGRMSRSGSISGTTFKSPYAKKTLPETQLDSAICHKAKKPAARNGFYISPEQLYSRTSSGKNYHHTSSEPATAHNSPSDDEDEDEDSDEDDEDGPSIVTSSTQVKNSTIPDS